MKIKYIGESFGVDSLTNGKIYEATIEDEDFYRVIDDSGEDYLYSRTHPAPIDGSGKGGKWEIVEADNSSLDDNKTTQEKRDFIEEYLLKIGMEDEDIDVYVYDDNIDDVYEFLKKHPTLNLEQAETKLWIFNQISYNTIYDEVKEKIVRYVGKRVKVLINNSMYGNALGTYIVGMLTEHKKGKYDYDDEITVTNEENSATFMIPDIKDIFRLKKDDHLCPLVDGDVVSEIECCNICLYTESALNKRYIRKRYLKIENHIDICKKCKDHFTPEDLKK